MATVYTVIHQDLDFKATPEKVYDALLDDRQFSAFTGGAAQIQREPGGQFTSRREKA